MDSTQSRRSTERFDFCFFSNSKLRIAHGEFKRMKFLYPLCILLILQIFASCQSQKSDLKSLIRNVESYHKDLLFERYEIAAKNIQPSSRVDWLNAIQAQHLRFAEIEIISTSQCDPSDVEDEEKVENCAVIESNMQWYSNGAPTVYSARVRSIWQYFKEDGWYIVEQNQY